MAKEKNDVLTSKEIYAEIGTTYRFFLNWRHALFAGYFLVLYALANSFVWLVKNELADLEYVVFSSGLLFSLSFWGLEVRIRDLYRVCTRAGREIEKTASTSGVYTELDSPELIKRSISHTRVLNWFYGLLSFGMFAGLIYSIWKLFA